MTERSRKIQHQILQSLLHGGLDPQQLAVDVCEPMFRVRHELLAMRRHRLVYERLEPGRIVWRLTSAGLELACHNSQLRLSA